MILSLRPVRAARSAAIVNDFGSINIDAELLTGTADAVIGLKNGCICCSLQGDLLRTLRLVLAHEPPPERIVIEASGAADPRGIVEMVMDPVLWGVVAMDAVACVIDAQDVADRPARMRDPLWLAQLRHADFALLAKTAAVPGAALSGLRALLAVEGRPVFDIDAEGLPADLLLGGGGIVPARRPPGPDRVRADRFITTDWQSPAPVSLAAFEAVLPRIAPGLLRAKGWLALTGQGGAPVLFQMVGRRASLAPATAPPGGAGCRLVLIGERGIFDADAALALLDGLTG